MIATSELQLQQISEPSETKSKTITDKKARVHVAEQLRAQNLQEDQRDQNSEKNIYKEIEKFEKSMTGTASAVHSHVTDSYSVPSEDTEVENLPSVMPAFYVFIMCGYIEDFKLQPDDKFKKRYKR